MALPNLLLLLWWFFFLYSDFQSLHRLEDKKVNALSYGSELAPRDGRREIFHKDQKSLRSDIIKKHIMRVDLPYGG